MRWTTGILVAAVGGMVASAFELEVARSGSTVSRADIMTVAEIRRGTRGHGLTVFETHPNPRTSASR